MVWRVEQARTTSKISLDIIMHGGGKREQEGRGGRRAWRRYGLGAGAGCQKVEKKSLATIWAWCRCPLSWPSGTASHLSSPEVADLAGAATAAPLASPARRLAGRSFREFLLSFVKWDMSKLG